MILILSARGRNRVIRNAQEGGDWEAQSWRIKFLSNSAAGPLFAHGDQRYTQAERMVTIIQSLNFIVRNKLEPFNFLGFPGTANRDGYLILLVTDWDCFRHAGL